MFSADGGGTLSSLIVEDLFSTTLYTGTGGSRSITNGINLSTYGGLVWTKTRNTTSNNPIVDTTRGVNLFVYSNLTNASAAGGGSINVFNTNGYNLGANSEVNTSSNTYVSWTFRKSKRFFDIVTYTGNGTTQTVAHNLGISPGLITIKAVNTTGNWATYHTSLGSDIHLFLNSTAASSATNFANYFGNNTLAYDPTSSLFTIGNNAYVNSNGVTYIAYLWAHDSATDGIVQCGTFTTDGSGSATVSSIGWEPQFGMFKPTSTTGDWINLDAGRGWDLGTSDKELYPDATTAETSTSRGNPTSTGFTFIGAVSTKYIYMVIRKGFMRIPTDATKVFAINASTGTGATRSITGVGFPPDLVISKKRSAINKHNWQDRLRGTASQITSDSISDLTILTDVITGFNQDGVTFGPDATAGSVNTNTATYVNYMFKEARGFFDKVTYSGTGTNRTVSHNLGVIPEMMIIKRYDGNVSWKLFWGDNTAYDDFSTGAQIIDSTAWNNTSPTSSVFTVGTNVGMNASGGNYIAYLFATAPGVSKIGTYTGTGTTNSINCGFSAGARFVMIKRLDSTGDWYYWDTTRGLISGNDPYLLFNSTAAEVSGNDYIDPYSPGFELSSTAPAALNANGGSFLFWAIA